MIGAEGVSTGRCTDSTYSAALPRKSRVGILQEALDVRLEEDEEKRTIFERVFDFIVNITIILNVMQLGVCVAPEETYPGTPAKDCCLVSDNFFVLVFVVEASYKLFKGGKTYWLDRWNWLDFSLALSGMLDAWIMMPIVAAIGSDIGILEDVMKILKLIRILRVIKLLRVFVQLRIILEGLIRAMQGMIWVSMLLLVIVYVGAVFGRTFFRSLVYPDDFALTFATLPKAFFTMFTLSIAADWTDIVSPVVKEIWWGSFFFTGFSFMTSFGILNLIIGIITERTASVQREYDHHQAKIAEHRLLKYLKMLSETVFAGREDISRARMSRVIGQGMEEDDDLTGLIDQIPLPRGWGLAECHQMFDKDHSGTITKDEFEEGMCSLLLSNENQRAFLMQKSISDVGLRLCRFEARFEATLLEELGKIHTAVAEVQGLGSGDRGPPIHSACPQPDTKIAHPYAEQGSTDGLSDRTEPKLQQEVPASPQPKVKQERPANPQPRHSATSRYCEKLLQGLATAAEAADASRVQLCSAQRLLTELRDDAIPGWPVRQADGPVENSVASVPLHADLRVSGLRGSFSPEELEAFVAMAHRQQEASGPREDSFEEVVSHENTEELVNAVNQLWQRQLQATAEYEESVPV